MGNKFVLTVGSYSSGILNSLQRGLVMDALIAFIAIQSDVNVKLPPDKLEKAGCGKRIPQSY